MKRILFALAVMLTAFAAQAQTITLRKWQDMGALVDRQSQAINTLKAEVATLKTETATLKSDVSLIIGRYDMLLRYLVVQACGNNAKIAQINAVFNWVQPLPLGNHECPAEGVRYYIPGYLSANGPPIPPTPNDEFTRTDVGANWSLASGATAQIAAGRLRVTGVATWAPSLGADHTIEARMWSPATSNYWPALVVRSATASGPQYRFVLAMGAGTWSIEHIDAAGAYSTIKTGSVTYAAGAKMRLAVVGQTITAYYADKLLGSVDDTRIVGGKPGVAAFGTGSYAEFDDVVVK